MSPDTTTSALGTATSERFANVIGESVRALSSLIRSLFAVLEARRRAEADRRALFEMSDRDLRDIGLDRGFLPAVARGRWTREAPDV